MGTGTAATSPSTTSTKSDSKGKPATEAKYDENSARRGLENRVFGGNASESDIRQLRAICSSQGDRVCRDRCTAMLKAKQQ